MKDNTVRPMTTAELFEKIRGILKENGKIPDIIDYGAAALNPVPVTTYAFDIRNNLAYGGNEGIYLDLWIERYIDGKKVQYGLGTFKTLDGSEDAMRTMAQLLADFIIEENKFVNSNLDDFTWEGADVHPIADGKELNWGYSCQTMTAAERKKDSLLEKYDLVVIRDNKTREKRTFRKSGLTC
jgi:hypothetical protein